MWKENEIMKSEIQLCSFFTVDEILDENWPYLQVLARLIFKFFMSGTFKFWYQVNLKNEGDNILDHVRHPYLIWKKNVLLTQYFEIIL